MSNSLIGKGCRISGLGHLTIDFNYQCIIDCIHPWRTIYIHLKVKACYRNKQSLISFLFFNVCFELPPPPSSFNQDDDAISPNVDVMTSSPVPSMTPSPPHHHLDTPTPSPPQHDDGDVSPASSLSRGGGLPPAGHLPLAVTPYSTAMFYKVPN